LKTADPSADDVGPDYNVEVVIGYASDGLYDEDLDEATVVKMASRFLPANGAHRVGTVGTGLCVLSGSGIPGHPGEARVPLIYTRDRPTEAVGDLAERGGSVR